MNDVDKYTLFKIEELRVKFKLLLNEMQIKTNEWDYIRNRSSEFFRCSKSSSVESVLNILKLMVDAANGVSNFYSFKERLNEIKDLADSYITYIKLSDFNKVNGEIGFSYAHKNAIANFKINV